MIDTHVHLHLMDQSVQDIMAAANHAGVTHVIQVAIDEQSIHQNLNQYSGIPNCFITGGIHPLSVSHEVDLKGVLNVLTKHIDRFVAIGEMGLDYKYGKENAVLQGEFFKAQLELARQHQKPVIIHSRHSDEDMLSIVNQFPDVRKVFHCYATHIDFFNALSGDLNYVSFTGMITYAKRGKVIHSMKHIPMDRLMIETDSPYLLPKGVQSHQNKPEYVSHVATAIAEHRDMTFHDVVEQTTHTAQLFFNLPL